MGGSGQGRQVGATSTGGPGGQTDQIGHRGRRVRLLGAAGASAAAFHLLPSALALGTWTSLRRAPGGLCHWRLARAESGSDGERGRSIALTFDDGPSEDSTPHILDRLDRLGLSATFFCLGSMVDCSPELVGEIARRGHSIATHGYSHEPHLLRSPLWVTRDLAAAKGSMATAGAGVRWFRPPYGVVSGTTILASRRLGMGIVLWSAWGREWADPEPRAVAERICRRLEPGAIVLLHDADSTSPPGTWKVTFEALGHIADEIHARGLETVSVDALADSPA